MLTKDLIYLGLIALAGVIFYFHGYFNGVKRKKSTAPDNKLNQADLVCEDPAEDPSSGPLYFFRGRSTLFRSEGRGNFGKN
ncbi:MAG: hypothetical protein JWM16_2446 [Verrucomicrobiales bacterium]|nr:hypothetical protein [Verrucomicrobiales bacterium]